MSDRDQMCQGCGKWMHRSTPGYCNAHCEIRHLKKRNPNWGMELIHVENRVMLWNNGWKIISTDGGSDSRFKNRFDIMTADRLPLYYFKPEEYKLEFVTDPDEARKGDGWYIGHSGWIRLGEKTPMDDGRMLLRLTEYRNRTIYPIPEPRR